MEASICSIVSGSEAFPLTLPRSSEHIWSSRDHARARLKDSQSQPNEERSAAKVWVFLKTRCPDIHPTWQGSFYRDTQNKDPPQKKHSQIRHGALPLAQGPATSLVFNCRAPIQADPQSENLATSEVDQAPENEAATAILKDPVTLEGVYGPYTTWGL